MEDACIQLSFIIYLWFQNLLFLLYQMLTLYSEIMNYFKFKLQLLSWDIKNNFSKDPNDPNTYSNHNNLKKIWKAYYFYYKINKNNQSNQS